MLYFLGSEIGSIVRNYTKWYTVMVDLTRYKILYWPHFGQGHGFCLDPFCEISHHGRAKISSYAPPSKWSDNIEPLDLKWPSDQNGPKSHGGHVPLICKDLTPSAPLNKCLCICSNCWPEKSSSESLAYQGPRCDVMVAHAEVNS